MIERKVFVKLKDAYANPQGRIEVRDRTLADFPNIPGVVDVAVGIPADDHALAAWDVCLVIRFDRYEDVAPYSVHPIHVAYLDDFLNPRAEVKKAWNFTMHTPA